MKAGAVEQARLKAVVVKEAKAAEARKAEVLACQAHKVDDQ